MLKYHQSIQLAISDTANFPQLIEGFEERFKEMGSFLDDDEIIKLDEWQTYYLKFYTENLDDSVPEFFKKITL